MKTLIENTIFKTATWIKDQDYSVHNEAEFCHIFFYHLMNTASERKIAAAQIRSEIKHFRQSFSKRQVKASIDFGIAKASNVDEFDLFLEIKTWIRPTHIKGAFTPNSSTSKRLQCVSDLLRLSEFVKTGLCAQGGLIIYEQGSTHLRRHVPEELLSKPVKFEESWIDTERISLGRRKEHIGVIWVSATSKTPNSYCNEAA